MIVFPNCKLNLGLHILQKREDGFHDLETIFYPVALQDALEVIHHPSPATDVNFTCTGLQVDGNLADNICIKAYHLLKKDFPGLPAVSMHLHKTIPMGAGLGGGSADGAFTLLLLNRKFNLWLGEQALLNYALALGSDCPFFIRNTPSYAAGRGENLEKISLDLSGYKVVLVNPQIHINTGWAFSQITPSLNRPSLKEVIQLPPGSWKSSLKNDFEEPVFAHYPPIREIKEMLYNQGATYASMTGSGSTVFALFSRDKDFVPAFPAHYFVKII